MSGRKPVTDFFDVIYDEMKNRSGADFKMNNVDPINVPSGPVAAGPAAPLETVKREIFIHHPSRPGLLYRTEKPTFEEITAKVRETFGVDVTDGKSTVWFVMPSVKVDGGNTPITLTPESLELVLEDESLKKEQMRLVFRVCPDVKNFRK